MADIISLSELANELGIAEVEIIGICEALGIPVKGAHSSVNIAYAEMIRRRAKLDGLSRGNSSKPQDRSSTPATNTERIRPPAKRRSLNLLHLQQHMSINGRDALASRQFLTHMRSDYHNTMVKAIVDEATVSNPELLADYLTPSEFLAEQPDVITSEGSLLSFGIDQLRINSELLRDYLTAGGVVIATHRDHNHSFGHNGARTGRRRRRLFKGSDVSVSRWAI